MCKDARALVHRRRVQHMSEPAAPASALHGINFKCYWHRKLIPPSPPRVSDALIYALRISLARGSQTRTVEQMQMIGERTKQRHKHKLRNARNVSDRYGTGGN